MSGNKINIQCSKYDKICDCFKCNFLKSVSLKYSALKLNNPNYYKQTVYYGLWYIQIKKSREPPHCLKSLKLKFFFH